MPRFKNLYYTVFSYPEKSSVKVKVVIDVAKDRYMVSESVQGYPNYDEMISDIESSCTVNLFLAVNNLQDMSSKDIILTQETKIFTDLCCNLIKLVFDGFMNKVPEIMDLKGVENEIISKNYRDINLPKLI